MLSLRSVFSLVCAVACSATLPARGQIPLGSPQLNELRTTRAYEAAVRQGPPTLRAFLTNFPKGADLHVHLSGAVYAETFIREAGRDGLCVNTVTLSFARPPCAGKLVPAQELSGNMSTAGQELYDKLIDSFSMRDFVPTPDWSAHDQFFATFARFGGLTDHYAEWIDEVARRAAAQNQQYLELMVTPPFSHAAQAAYALGWNAELEKADPHAFARLRQELLGRGLRQEVAVDRAEVRAAETGRQRMEHCGTPQAASACQVEIRFLYQILRGYPPQQVFAQMLLGFETAEASIDAHEPGFVGINLVMPEDGYISMRDYTLQMKMVGYLHELYPKVHIALHAGELAEGMVPPEGLRFHIRQAVKIAHAERVGHGVDVMEETNAEGLLREMAEGHVMVEINLTSNKDILGISGVEHPFPIYWAAHVPVALSTDDEGVSRIDLTHEYEMAVLEYHLSYADLKELARTSMEHTFLPGESLWAKPDQFGTAATACRSQVLGGDQPSASCKGFLGGSEKAAAQWELERRFRDFEAQF